MKKILLNIILVTFVIAFATGCAEARYSRENHLSKPDFGARYNHDQPADEGMGIKIYD